MSDSTGRLLSELRVPELRAELEKRSLPTAGIKIALFERLEKAMKEEGLDTSKHRFGEAAVAVVAVPAAASTSAAPTTEALAPLAEPVTVVVSKEEVKEVAAEPTAEVPLVDVVKEPKPSAKVEVKEEVKPVVETPVVEPKKINAVMESVKEAEKEPLKEAVEEPMNGVVQAEEKPKTDVIDAAKEREMATRSLWVRNVKPGTKAAELKALFGQAGHVVRAKIFTMKDKPGTPGAGSGCVGYVTMLTVTEADLAIHRLNKSVFKGGTVTVGKASPEKLPFIKKTPVPKKEEPKKEEKPKEEKKKEEVAKVPIERKAPTPATTPSQEKKSEAKKTEPAKTSASHSTTTTPTAKKETKPVGKIAPPLKKIGTEPTHRVPIPPRFPVDNRRPGNERRREESAADKEKRELARRLAEKEAEHRKREEELRLQRERERVRYEKEKIEKEKLLMQLKALEAKESREKERIRPSRDRPDRERGSSYVERASYIAPAAPPHGRVRDFRDSRPPVPNRGLPPPRIDRRDNDRRDYQRVESRGIKRDMNHPSTIQHFNAFRRDDTKRRRSRSRSPRSRPTYPPSRGLSSSAFAPSVQSSRNAFAPQMGGGNYAGAYNTGVNNSWSQPSYVQQQYAPRRY